MGADTRELLSVGIDVGTTTTEVVFSHLTVRNSARPGMAPRIEVRDKAVAYRSPVHITPLRGPDEIDTQALAIIVRGEYAAAGVTPGQVETGAVIITGETARAKNADAVLAALSDLAGDFVVTVAGPNVEAQIAGRGSGAAAYSAQHFTQVTNVDVGGGTANAAIFHIGEHLSSSGLAVGGRQLRLEPTTGRVTHVAPPGRHIIAATGLPITEGEIVDVETLRRFCDVMAELTLDLVEGESSQLGAALQLSPPLTGAGASSAVFFSGGVGDCFYDRTPAHTLADVAVYGDVGPLLAQSLRLNTRLQDHTVLRPAETMRATVLGAASQTVTLSGSTIWAEPQLLPLRNLPVVRPHLEADVLDPDRLAEAIRVAVRRWDAEGDGRVAVALDLPPRLDYAALNAVAEGIGNYATSDLPADAPVIVVIKRDYAQALGQTIKGLRPQQPLVVIDQVGLGEGDFIDIGLPMLDGRVVPLSVKTLVFYS
jgi:ethanolamine utilization protein EutA